MIKFYMFAYKSITKVNWNYTESAWQNYVNTWALHLSHNNPANVATIQYGDKSASPQLWPCSPLNFGIPLNPIFTVKLWGHDHKQNKGSPEALQSQAA